MPICSAQLIKGSTAAGNRERLAAQSNQIKSNQINRRVATNGGSDRHVISHWHDARQIKHTTQAGPSPKLRLRLRLWLWLWLGLKLDLP